jgi:hypothetical protein
MPKFPPCYAGRIHTSVRILIAAVTLSVGLTACSKSEVGANGSTTTATSTQLNWDQGNWNQANWQ